MMNPESKKNIIRGARVKGIAFFEPNPQALVDSPVENRTDLKGKIQELLLQKQGVGEDFTAEVEDIWTEGYQKGLLEGQKQGYEVGKQESFETGFKEGVEKSRGDLIHLGKMMNSAAMTLASKQEGIFEQMKPELIKFALTICEHVLKRTLSDSKVLIDLIERLLSEAIVMLRDGRVTIVLSPQDLILIEKDLKTIIYDQVEIKKLNFIADKSIEQGNCRVETSLGLINFDIKRILADLEKKF